MVEKISLPQPIKPPEALKLRVGRATSPEKALRILGFHKTQDDIHSVLVGQGIANPPEGATRRIALRELSHRARTDRSNRVAEHNLDLAMRDPLTGLWTRRYVSDQLSVRLNGPPVGQPEHRTPTGHSVSAVIADIRDMKTVNDKESHDAGDDMVVGAAHGLRDSLLRKNDVAGRWTQGDELVAVLDILPSTTGDLRYRKPKDATALVALRANKK